SANILLTSINLLSQASRPDGEIYRLVLIQEQSRPFHNAALAVVTYFLQDFKRFVLKSEQ
ncbi:MAG: hypothetical protein ABI822_27935, partial [Bryobacteraceae bacterium]